MSVGLLCSWNAHAWKVLVRHAQWESKQAALLGRGSNQGKMRRESGQVPFLLAERARSEGARSMRAVKGNLGHSL
jgi:hypothetical protein